MKKLNLRPEYLGELSTAEMRKVAGAAGGMAAVPAAGTISDGSCVCYLIPAGDFGCDISDGSCVCTQTR